MDIIERMKSIKDDVVASVEKEDGVIHSSFDFITDKLNVMDGLDHLKDHAIDQFVSIDFEQVINGVEKLRFLNPKIDIVLISLQKVKGMVDAYKASESENREDKLVDGFKALAKDVELNEIIEVLEPFVNKIPFGAIVLVGLRFIVSIVK